MFGWTITVQQPCLTQFGDSPTSAHDTVYRGGLSKACEISCGPNVFRFAHHSANIYLLREPQGTARAARGGVAGLAAHTKGAPRHQAEEREECNESAETAHRTDGTFPSKLQESHVGMRPVGCHVRSGIVVEARQCPQNNWLCGRVATAGQLGGTDNNGSLSDDQPRSAIDGVRTQTSNQSAGKSPAPIRTAAARPTAGRESQRDGQLQHSSARARDYPPLRPTPRQKQNRQCC